MAAGQDKLISLARLQMLCIRQLELTDKRKQERNGREQQISVEIKPADRRI